MDVNDYAEQAVINININNSVQQFCRLCLSETSLSDIFFHEDLHLLICTFLSIVISEDDKMSQKICCQCLSKLTEFKDFKQNCLEVQESLQSEFYTKIGDQILEDPDIELTIAEIRKEPESAKQNVQLEEFRIANTLEEAKDTTCADDRPAKRKKIYRLQEIRTTNAGRKRYIYDLKEAYRNQLLECDVCGKNIAKIRMEGHKNMHKGVRPFKCERGCEADFHCQQLRLHHYRNVHDGEFHECDICQKTYRSKRSLSYHKKDVHSAKPFICVVCSQAFSSNARLNQHMKFHNGEKNHPCSVCSYSFYSNHDLKKHMKTHIEQQPPDGSKSHRDGN